MNDLLRDAMRHNEDSAQSGAEVAASVRSRLQRERTRRRGKLLAVAAFTLSAAAVAAIVAQVGGFSGQSATTDADDVRVIEATEGGSSLFPNSTATDWATFADHLVRVTVVEEVADSPSEAMGDEDSALQFRLVRARVDDVLWSRGGASQPPVEIEWNAYGWSLRPGERSPVTAEHEIRPQVGRAYVMPISYAPAPSTGNDAWLPFAPDAIINEDDGRLVGPIPGGISPSQDFLAPFLNRPTSDLVRALSQAPPYPAAAALMDAPFERRVRAVF